MVNLNPDKSERRKHTRVKFHEKITVHDVLESKSGNVFEVNDLPHTVQSLNISEGGIRLELSDNHNPPSILKLKIDFKDKSLDLYGKLIWKAQGLCGLQFLLLDEEVRNAIRGLVSKNMKE